MIIYKYVVPKLLEILQNSKIRFSQISALNDPYEVKSNMVLYKQEGVETICELMGQVEQFNGVSLEEKQKVATRVMDAACAEIETSLEKILILSLTLRNNNFLMWSHYADSHAGFAIGFDMKHPFFNDGALFKTSRLLPVKYSKNRVKLPKFEMPNPDFYTNPNPTEPPLENFTLDFYLDLLRTKSEDWRYEEEFRIFTETDPAWFSGKQIRELDLYLFDFPKDAVKEIVFGNQMPFAARLEIAKIIEKDYPDCLLYEAALADDSFNLRILPFIPNEGALPS